MLDGFQILGKLHNPQVILYSLNLKNVILKNFGQNNKMWNKLSCPYYYSYLTLNAHGIALTRNKMG